MNLLTVGLGLLILGYAIFVLIMRLQKKDAMFRKLGPMRQRWGETAGSVIHYVGYVAIPAILGLALILGGAMGLNILQVLR